MVPIHGHFSCKVQASDLLAELAGRGLHRRDSMRDSAETPHRNERDDRKHAPFVVKPPPTGFTDPPFAEPRPPAPESPMDRFDPDAKEFRARWWPNLSSEWE
jgi:hypothetical protein